MTTALILCLLLCAASAAPAEEKIQPKELEEMKIMPIEEEELALVDPVPEAEDGEAMFQEAGAPEARFNVCPYGWLAHGAECFQFNKLYLSWFDAEEYCNNEGGHLASAKTSQQHNFMKQMSQGMSLSNPWLGGFYLQGKWLWINRDGFYYTQWPGRGSSPSYSASSNSCVFLYPSGDYWENSGCGTARHFICSRKISGC